MDDAEKRRGRPAMHRRFNEALAIQAALWLLGISRSLLARAAAKAGSAAHSVDPVAAAARVSVLQQQTEDALHLGQFLDLVGSLERAEVDPEEVARLKCGRLFALAAEVPAWLPCREAAPSGLALALEAFGESVGIAYQIRDDLDDDAEDERAATWSDDEASGRPTLVAAAGRDAAAARIEVHLARAGAALAPLAAAGVDPQPLIVLTSMLLGRPEGASPAPPG
jgi:geranylgeranyl pyrophosphate synthase